MFNWNERDVILVDIGEILSITCVKCAENFRDNVYAIETKAGRFLTKSGLLSHQQPEVDIVLPCGSTAQVFDERICALNYSFNSSFWTVATGTAIQVGDRLPLMQSQEAWNWIRDNCEYNLIDVSFHWMRLRRKWITPDGVPTDEPEWFIPKLAMFTVFSSLHYIQAGHSGPYEYDQMQHWLHDIVSLSQDWYLTSDEFDELVQAGAVISIAARTINHHIDKGDFKPNPRKLSDFERIDFKLIDEASLKSDFADHLKGSCENIWMSKRENYKTRISFVQAYHPGRFPKTYVHG